MYSIFRNRFGVPGVISVIALVFAMMGGAYAASKGGSASASRLNSKQKKEVKTIAKSFQGTGPAGAPGQAGPEGKQGPKGDPGANGTDGTDGADGTFSTEPLPSGETLTGVWSAAGDANEESLGSISFPIPTSAAPTAVLQADVASAVGVTLESEIIAPDLEFTTHCPGSPTDPQAAKGFLCIYISKLAGSNVIIEPNAAYQPASKFGVTIPFKFTGATTIHYARGTWALTGA